MMAKSKTRSRASRPSTKKPVKGKSAANSDKLVRIQIAEFIGTSHAHVSWKHALAGIPADVRGVKPAGSPYSLWQLLEHLRLAQWDILEFTRDSKHVSPGWPTGYWPSSEAPPSEKDWDKSLRDFEHDLNDMKDLVLDPKTDLHARIPHGTGQTVLREALLVADHNAYHLGEIVLLRRLLGAWKA